ncbi:MAG: ribonuclease E/G, partial [bacterium]
QIESAFSREVTLPSGGAIVLDHTEALLSIDINSARATKGSDIEDTALNTNLEAATEVARQLKLRDIGGLIVIDFIDMMNPKNQRKVEERMKEAVKNDRARIQLGKISRFGLLEMSRQRLRPSLGESSQRVCPRCTGQGTIRTVESLALSILRLIQEEALKDQTGRVNVRVPTPVANYLLNEKRSVLAKIEQRFNVPAIIVADSTLVTPEYSLDRIRVTDLPGQPESSYALEAKAVPEVNPVSEKEEKKTFSSPAVKLIDPAKPAPERKMKEAKEENKESEKAGGFFARLFAWMTSSEEENKPEQKKQQHNRRPNNRNRNQNPRNKRNNTRGRKPVNQRNPRGRNAQGAQKAADQNNKQGNQKVDQRNKNRKSAKQTERNNESKDKNSNVNKTDKPVAQEQKKESTTRSPNRRKRGRRGGRNRRPDQQKNDQNKANIQQKSEQTNAPKQNNAPDLNSEPVVVKVGVPSKKKVAAKTQFEKELKSAEQVAKQVESADKSVKSNQSNKADAAQDKAASSTQKVSKSQNKPVTKKAGKADELDAANNQPVQVKSQTKAKPDVDGNVKEAKKPTSPSRKKVTRKKASSKASSKAVSSDNTASKTASSASNEMTQVKPKPRVKVEKPIKDEKTEKAPVAQKKVSKKKVTHKKATTKAESKIEKPVEATKELKQVKPRKRAVKKETSSVSEPVEKSKIKATDSQSGGTTKVASTPEKQKQKIAEQPKAVPESGAKGLYRLEK